MLISRKPRAWVFLSRGCARIVRMNEANGGKRSIQAPHVDEATVSDISRACGLRPLTARLLVARGHTTPAAVQRFLTPSLQRDWLPPEGIPGLQQVADCVQAAIQAGTRILVFGDFDVDGITATAISVRGLRALGADVAGLIPHRYEEGYALSEAAVQRGMRQFSPGLVMTVDCGISCGQEVQRMLQQGLAVAITDHHEPGEHVPQDVPVADPKLEEGNPSHELCGAGVALKLICLLGQRLGQPQLWRQFTDFAALGTVADLMELAGENRALVADGIARINADPRPCLAALLATCNVAPGGIDSTKLSYSLIPRINAAGRMGDATVALDLLLSDEVEQAQALAAQLDAINTQRREAEAQLTQQVNETLEAQFADEPVIVVGGKGWHEGVKGIVASRIARTYKRPAIVFGIDEQGVARGSGRTFGGVNLFELAGSASELYQRYGGHSAAIGITLPADALPELRSRLGEELSRLALQQPAQGVAVDALVGLDECTVEGFEELELLQPFGAGNRLPLLAAENVFLERRGTVGKQGNHFRYEATDGASRVAGIFFGPQGLEGLVACEGSCDVVFEPSVDEWQGRKTAKLMTRDIIVHDAAPEPLSEVQAHVEELFAHEAEIVDTGEYAGITQAARFNTKVVGVTFENRQELLAGLEAGVELELVRHPENEMDENAIGVHLPGGAQLGFLNRHLAKRLAPVMDAGTFYDAAVTAVTGGPGEGQVREAGPLGVRDPGVTSRSYGVNIVVRRPDLERAEEQLQQQGAQELGRLRGQWASVPAGELDECLREALIGEHELHAAQAETLANLAAGLSTLTVMATGRGKSLIFHLHAARTALRQHRASIFVYPLRALVADQAYHLQATFSRFGLEVRVLTGETAAEERARIYEGLAQGSIDIILTTPEFLCIHAQKFQATGRIGFVVVDEAHHIGLAKAGNRPAYAELSQALATLGHPLVLAVTATAGDEEARLICQALGIQRLVLDATVRENLHIDDRRDLRDRDHYIASLIAAGGKCIVYVNSREQSMGITRSLRRLLPELGPRISFYNAGLSKPDRKRIEAAFRSGELVAIVSTSAFGEGIDIPDVRHVVLYHLPFSSIEFNQMAGRVGRDGQESQVHLLYSYGDARINQSILASGAPVREAMVALYRTLCAAQQAADGQGEEGFAITNSELASQAQRLLAHGVRIDEGGVSCGIAVFRELGFLETSGRGVARRIRMVPGPERMQLSASVRYREGLGQIENFEAFRQWALSAPAEELLARFNRPILPSEDVAASLR